MVYSRSRVSEYVFSAMCARRMNVARRMRQKSAGRTRIKVLFIGFQKRYTSTGTVRKYCTYELHQNGKGHGLTARVTTSDGAKSVQTGNPPVKLSDATTVAGGCRLVILSIRLSAPRPGGVRGEAERAENELAEYRSQPVLKLGTCQGDQSKNPTKRG